MDHFQEEQTIELLDDVSRIQRKRPQFTRLEILLAMRISIEQVRNEEVVVKERPTDLENLMRF